MIDIHSHILPALDDGPESFEEAVKLVAALAAAGVTQLVATPRYGPQHTQIDAAEVERRVQALERLLHRQRIFVRLWPGHEASLEVDIERLLVTRTLATINDGPYVLLDLPTLAIPRSLLGLIPRLRRIGFVPILAHVERCTEIRRNTDALVPLVEAGALTQVTVSSLVGGYGPGIRRTAEELLLRNMAHVLASGVHGMRDAPASVEAGLRAAQALVGRERLWELAIGVPQVIVQGGPVLAPHPLPAVRRHDADPMDPWAS